VPGSKNSIVLIHKNVKNIKKTTTLSKATKIQEEMKKVLSTKKEPVKKEPVKKEPVKKEPVKKG